MRSIELLDCTLRDGGYVNDWRFGRTNLVSIFERLVDANVDIIEVGFIDDRRPFDKDRSIFPDTKSADKIYGLLDKKKTIVVGMIDFGTCAIENLSPCSESYLDGIRVIFKKGKMKAAMEYCRQVKELGYKVFSQLVSVTSYSDAELLELIKLVNDVKPYGVSMVDTYGLLDNDWLLHLYKILDDNVACNRAKKLRKKCAKIVVHTREENRLKDILEKCGECHQPLNFLLILPPNIHLPRFQNILRCVT